MSKTSLRSSQDTAVCSVRGTEHPRDEMYTTHEGELICAEEYEDNWSVCCHSGELHRTDAMLVAGRHRDELVSRSVVSSGTYARCGYFESCMPATDGAHVDGYGWVSATGLHAGDFSTCEDCGDWFHHDDLDSDCHCSCCAGDDSVIRDYGDRSYPRALGTGPLFYGVELEVEVRSGHGRTGKAEETQRKLTDRFVILKDDGSLDDGFEIVTAPATFEQHKLRWAPFFDAVPVGLRSWKTDTCGMHVHVSREALSGLQIGKILVFVNRPEHSTFIEQMAGRNSSYAVRVSKKIADGLKFEHERYRAVNTGGERTIEFRIFKGTLNRQRFFGNLEFVDALVAYTAPAERSIQEATDLAPFCRWVARHRKRYPNLFARLVQHRHVPAPSAKPQAPAVLVETTADSNT